MHPAARSLPVVLFSTALLAVALFFVGLAADHGALRLLSKPVPALTLATWALLARPGSATHRWLAAGLVLGAGGDALLEASEAAFVPGLASFLLGHLAYSVAFSREARVLAPLQALPLGLGVLAISSVLLPALGDLAGPVVVYILAIAVMAWRAAAFAQARGGWAWASLAGAVLFLFSDTVIALDRFVDPIPGALPIILVTYWLGQLGIAVGVLGSGPRCQTG